MSEPSVITKARFYLSASSVYALALIFLLQSAGITIIPSAPVRQFASALPSPPIAAPQKPVRVIKSGKPNKIFIPKLELELPITDGAYDEKSGAWTLSDNHAHYALPSIQPNDFSGNTLIYGHKYDWVFGPIKYLGAGDKIQIFTENGLVFNYIYDKTEELKPDDTSVFRSNGQPTVTLQTCSGRWLEKRQMVVFKLERVDG